MESRQDWIWQSGHSVFEGAMLRGHDRNGGRLAQDAFTPEASSPNEADES
jgi:hypothetical protein